MIYYENVVSYKDKVYIREYDSDKKTSIFKKETIIPKLYRTTHNQSELKSFIQNHNLEEIKIKDLKDFRNVIKNYKNQDITLYGRKNSAFEYIFENHPDAPNQHHSQRTWSIDIEVTGKIDKECLDPKTAWKPEYAFQEVTLIQYYDSYEKKYYILGLKDLETPLENTKYIKFSSESNLLKGFLKLLEYQKPAILIGWNTFGYDYPYLTNRIARVLDNYKGSILDEDGKAHKELLNGAYVKTLSPFKIIQEDYKLITSKEVFSPNWIGITLEDYLHLYKKYAFTELGSFSLNSVCSHELGDQKVSYNEFENIDEFYQKNYQKFVEYGLKDIELLVSLDKKLNLLQLAQSIANMCWVSIADVRGTLKQWLNKIYNEAFLKNRILSLDCEFKNTELEEIIKRNYYSKTKQI